MKAFFSLLFCFLTIATVGQTKKMPNIDNDPAISGDRKSFNIPCTKTGVFSYSHHLSNIGGYNLGDLYFSRKKFHFRFTYPRYSIEISTEDSINYSGEVVLHIIQTKKKIGDKYFNCGEYKRSIRTIDTHHVRAVLNLVSKYKILTIPTDEDVDGWIYKNGDIHLLVSDGVIYFMEYSTNDSYTFRQYSNPQVYMKAYEAIAINSFQDQVKNVLDLEKKFDEFVTSLPIGTYVSEDMRVINNYPNKEEERKAEDTKEYYIPK